MHTIIGLTGPMAAGKNLAGSILAQKGCAVIDTDKAAHQALEQIQERVLERFSVEAERKGLMLRGEDGKIQRKVLGQLVFADAALLSDYEKMLYPELEKILEDFIAANQDKIVVINGAVLYKSAIIHRCDKLLYVDSPALFRFLRVRKRDKLPVKQILQRFASQKNLYSQHRSHNADIYKVNNKGNLKSFEQKIYQFLDSVKLELTEQKDTFKEDTTMEQKRILWIVAAVGVFLLIVIGSALILYSPAKSNSTVVTSLQPEADTWVKQPETPANPNEQVVKDLTVIAGTANVYSDSVTTIDLNQLGNEAASNATAQDITTVTESTTKKPTAVPALTETPQPASNTNVTVTQPKTSTATAPAKPATETSTAKAPAAPSTAKPAATSAPAAAPSVAKPAAAKVTTTEYWIQAGSFSTKSYAEEARSKLAKNKIESEVFTKDVSGTLYYRVRVGPHKTKTEAEYWLGIITSDPSFQGSYITEVKTQK